jgi:NADH-quinone oxidoreductase subunit M
MQLTGVPILSILLLAPLLGAVVIGFLPKDNEWLIKRTALFFAFVTFAISLPLFAYNQGLLFDVSGIANSANHFQFVERNTWLPEFGISYHLGIDGIALLLIVMTTFLQIAAVWISFSTIHERFKEYFIMLLVLETGMVGVFCALDLVLFYVFYEVMLVPMYFLIGIWGGQRRIYAAVKFFLYTMAGSMLMLVAIMSLFFYVHAQTGVWTFDLLQIKTALANSRLPLNTELLMFVAFAIAFAIKVPMFPFHTWLPDAHVEAPTAGSVILAGVLLKVGTFGFVRLCIPLFPMASQTFAPYILVIAVIGVIYGALVAAVQPDFKKLVAYSSVSHLGFVMLGLFAFTPQALSGAVLQMINHGVSTGALFLLVGMIYERRHTREIAALGGLWEQMPVFGRIFLIVTFSSIGLPLTNGFVGEFLILLGSFQSAVPGAMLATALATTGVIWSAIYMLWMFQRIMYGPVDKPENRRLRDVSRDEFLILAPFVILIFWLGIYPSTFTRKMDTSLNYVLREARDVRPMQYQALTPGPSPNAGRGETSTRPTSASRAAEAEIATGTPLPALGEGPGVRAASIPAERSSQ